MKPHEEISWSEIKKALPGAIITVAGALAFVWGFCYAMAMIGVLIR